jgi:hypothetical protein
MTLISFVLDMLNNLVDDIDPDLDLNCFLIEIIDNLVVESDPDLSLD